ncbi:MAG: BMP family ABC transporter substrate-binding protein [Gammaproteobacteria bacterium]|nr:MAG: BMP family ABC transporter substrate-binding protein [Gammaproteobacteria bacterium]
MQVCMGVAFAAATTLAAADGIKPAVVYDMGGKFDKSFNEAVSKGLEKFTKDTGIKVREFEPNNETQFSQAHRKFAQRGFDPIIGVGFNQATTVKDLAPKFKDTHYVLIDSVVDAPNVKSILFKEHEGSFLVGMAAALKSKTGKVGFVGGMDIPLIRKFECGYEQGAKYVNPNIEVFANMTGTTPAAWHDLSRGAELAKGQFERGVDVIFAAAGATGLGVYQAAKDAGKYAIGVDSNQNYLHPGTMLTSMVKRVGVAAYKALDEARNGKFKPGIEHLGLAENGVDWAVDEYNASLITDEMKQKIEQAKKDIVAGKIKVHDYMTNNSCDY